MSTPVIKFKRGYAHWRKSRLLDSLENICRLAYEAPKDAFHELRMLRDAGYMAGYEYLADGVMSHIFWCKEASSEKETES